MSTEVFADYSTNISGISNLYLITQAAVGVQNIKANIWNAAYRLQTELSYKSTNYETSLKYQTSNVASGTGYQFDMFSFTLLFKW